MSIDADDVVQKLIEAYGEAREEAGRSFARLQDSGSRERSLQADLANAVRDKLRLQLEASQREQATKRYEALYGAAAAVHEIFDDVIPPGSVVRQVAEDKFAALKAALRASDPDIMPF